MSPFWYVTSRKRLLSSIAYIRSTAAAIMASTAFSGPPCLPVSSSASGRFVVRYWRKILAALVLVGPLDLDLHVETAGAQDGGVDEVLAVGRADHDHVLQALDAVDLGQQLRHDRALDVGGDAGAAGAEQGVHLVEEHDDRVALLRLLPRALEDEADLALGLAHVLVEQLGALDVEEEGPAPRVAGLLRSPAARVSWRRPWR